MFENEIIETPTPAQKAAIERFLSEMDNEFEQPLSTRMPIADYLEKLLKYGHIIMAKYGQDYAGMVAFYCNDIQNQIGFLSILAVKPRYRGQGLGTTLFLTMLHAMRKAGMKCAQLGTSANNPSVRLYERLGFETIHQYREGAEYNRVMMEYVFPIS